MRGRVGLRPSGRCGAARVASAARSRPPALCSLSPQVGDRRERGGAALDQARFTSCLRLRGGGGDGGATGAESRSSYLEMYKTQKTGAVRASRCAAPTRALTRGVSLQMDAREEQLAVWTCCRLTRQPLGGDDGKADVVRGGARLGRSGHALTLSLAQAMCQLGYLYNREPVLQCLKESLVDGVPMPALVKHIVSLKDLTTLQLASSSEDGAAPAAVASTGDFRAATHVRYACPLTGAPRCQPASHGSVLTCRDRP